MNDRERLIDILYKGFYISPENDIKGTAQGELLPQLRCENGR